MVRNLHAGLISPGEAIRKLSHEIIHEPWSKNGISQGVPEESELANNAENQEKCKVEVVEAEVEYRKLDEEQAGPDKDQCFSSNDLTERIESEPTYEEVEAPEVDEMLIKVENRDEGGEFVETEEIQIGNDEIKVGELVVEAEERQMNDEEVVEQEAEEQPEATLISNNEEDQEERRTEDGILNGPIEFDLMIISNTTGPLQVVDETPVLQVDQSDSKQSEDFKCPERGCPIVSAKAPVQIAGLTIVRRVIRAEVRGEMGAQVSDQRNLDALASLLNLRMDGAVYRARPNTNRPVVGRGRFTFRR